jgi:predicted  nucleic acid-binding Zn-ribbon protein
MGKPVPELKKLSSEGKLGKDALEALYQQLGKDYAGQMKTQSGTFSGMVSNFKDAVSGLLTDIGNAILPFAKALMPAIQAAFGGFGDKLKSNLPAVIDGIAGALKGLLDLPGQVLRGLALVSMGFADMVADIQSSAASLMSGLGQSLMNIPGMQDFAGSLIAGATNLTVAAAKTRDAGKTTFDNLIAGADKADAAVKPVKDSIEKARQAAQAGIQLKLDLAPIDKDIATAKTKINQIQQNIKNPKLKADKDYWNQQLREAQGDLKKLRDKKATVKFDAKAAPLKQKIADANAALTRLKKRKATPEIRAKITDFQRKRNAAVHALATLQVKKANPKLNANSADFKKKVSAAEKRLKDASKKKAEPKIKAKDETAKGVNSAKKNINSVKDHTVTIRVNTVRTTTTRKKTVPAGGSGSAPTAGGQSVMPSSVVLSTPPATVPVVQIQFNDPMLKGLISAQIQQRAQTAVQSSQTRAAVTL